MTHTIDSADLRVWLVEGRPVTVLDVRPVDQRRARALPPRRRCGRNRPRPRGSGSGPPASCARSRGALAMAPLPPFPAAVIVVGALSRGRTISVVASASPPASAMIV